jgi:hypothetical protein
MTTIALLLGGWMLGSSALAVVVAAVIRRGDAAIADPHPGHRPTTAGQAPPWVHAREADHHTAADAATHPGGDDPGSGRRPRRLHHV